MNILLAPIFALLAIVGHSVGVLTDHGANSVGNELSAAPSAPSATLRGPSTLGAIISGPSDTDHSDGHKFIGVAVVDIGYGTKGKSSSSISSTALDSDIHGPRTVPVVIVGPSGKVEADGLWGPPDNVGSDYHHGYGYGYH